MPAALMRQLQDSDIVCPAGRRVGDACVTCAVESSVIDGRVDPSSIESFCAGDYTACPSWREERERTARGKRPGTVLEDAIRTAEGNQQRNRIRAEVRRKRAINLLTSDDDEAVRFRARSGLRRLTRAEAEYILALNEQ